jgi:hypothetical protein
MVGEVTEAHRVFRTWVRRLDDLLEELGEKPDAGDVVRVLHEWFTAFVKIRATLTEETVVIPPYAHGPLL